MEHFSKINNVKNYNLSLIAAKLYKTIVFQLSFYLYANIIRLMEIRQIKENKKQFLDLLLLADEQEDMIYKYLDRGDMFALYDNGLKSICVVTNESADTFELKNLATYPHEQSKGYGSRLVSYVLDYYKDKGASMLVGTGNVPTIIGFYEQCGFKKSHIVKDFFTLNYNHPIVEDGILLTDMIYLKKNLKD